MVYEATGPAKKKHGIRAGVYVPTFEELKEFSSTLSDFLAKHPEVSEHIDALLGQVRSQSRHAGGVVIGENLDQYMPMVSLEASGKLRGPKGRMSDILNRWDLLSSIFSA